MIFFDPMLSRKAIATNSLKQTFVWDVWFHGQIVCCKIQSTPIDSNSSIDANSSSFHSIDVFTNSQATGFIAFLYRYNGLEVKEFEHFLPLIRLNLWPRPF